MVSYGFLESFTGRSLLNLGSVLLTWLITWRSTVAIDKQRLLKYLPEETKKALEERDKKIKILEATNKALKARAEHAEEKLSHIWEIKNL